MIELNNLTKQYKGKLVLDIPSLEISPNQIFGLVGNNGAGKTTLIKLMLDLIRASTGVVSIEQKDVSKSEDWKKEVGAFVDENFLIGHLSPEEYFQFLAKIYGWSKADLDIYLSYFTDLFSDEVLGHKKYIRDLSKGNKKKVGIASAFIGNPHWVILDEPFENLDPSSQIRLKKILKKFKLEKNISYIISSHDLSHLTELSDRIALLENGKIIKDQLVNEATLQELTAYFSMNTED